MYKELLSMREDAEKIMSDSITEVLPDIAVKKALEGMKFEGNLYVISFGKAGWQMAYAASQILKGKIKKGVIVTKYHHIKGDIPGFQMIEAGHPIPDQNSIYGAECVMNLIKETTEKDTILMLISGGGSALLEKPEKGLSLEEIQEVTKQLLDCGAGIQEINTIRKRLSAVKGGKLAALAGGKAIYQIVLSDVIDNNLEMVASGPACADSSTCADVMKIKKKYGLHFSERVEETLRKETVKSLSNVSTVITGSVKELCRAVAKYAEKRGYKPYILTISMNGEAREAGRFLASIARDIHKEKNMGFVKPCALIAGGETVVTLTGNGMGGRNQELAFSGAAGIADLSDTLLFSFGSDGTDGPTDAAGGIVDGDTMNQLRECNLDYEEILKRNDTYHALKKVGGLLFTGATGTNVNDVAVVLIR